MICTHSVQYVRAAAVLGLSLGALGLGGCETTTSDNDLVPITSAEIRQVETEGKKGEMVLLDPRSRKAYDQERIAGARHAQIEKFTGRAGDIDPSIAAFPMIVVYGDDPGSVAARALAKKMMASGYEGVRFYMGGLSEWRRAELPREGSAVSAVKPATPTAP